MSHQHIVGQTAKGLHAGADAGSPSEDAEISWDIDITEAAEGTDTQGASGNAGQSGASDLQSGGGAQGRVWPETAVRLSEDSSCRTAFLDDLYELNSFLLQQIQELTAGAPGCL